MPRLHPSAREMLLGCVLLLAACGGSSAPTAPKQEQATSAARIPAQTPPKRSSAPAAEPTNSVAEASLPEPRFDPTSAQGAADVVQTYYALIEAGKYREAWRLRWPQKGLSLDEFEADFERYADYHATVGAPSSIGGAAGSLYVEVPVQLYGRLRSGKPFGAAGTVTLRRVNDVPGSTADERRWRIYTSN